MKNRTVAHLAVTKFPMISLASGVSLQDVPDNAVLSSHGDVIPDLVNGLLRRGMELDASRRSPRKGSVIVLHHMNKLFTHAEYWDRPRVQNYSISQVFL